MIPKENFHTEKLWERKMLLKHSRKSTYYNFKEKTNTTSRRPWSLCTCCGTWATWIPKLIGPKMKECDHALVHVLHVDVPKSNIGIVYTPPFEWYVVRCGSMNIHKKCTCIKKIRLCAHNILTILESIFNIIEGPTCKKLNFNKTTSQMTTCTIWIC